MDSCSHGPPPGRLLLAVLSAAAMLAAACDNDGPRLFADLGNPTAQSVSLSRDVQPIFTARCALANCHVGSLPAQLLSLESGVLFDPVRGIVGVNSLQVPSMPRVTPGDSDTSYLVHKIQGSFAAVGGGGERMPLRDTPLSDSAILTIRKWIDQGALDN